MEQVEVGDKYPKQIASGLRAHYTQEEMDGRRILVVTNLKTAKLGGETSSGMVLCAKEGDKAVFVEPPADAKVRVLESVCPLWVVLSLALVCTCLASFWWRFLLGGPACRPLPPTALEGGL